MKCPKCGYENINNNTNFCANCGSTLSENNINYQQNDLNNINTISNSNQTIINKENGKPKKIIFILIGVVAIIASILGAISILSTKDEQKIPNESETNNSDSNYNVDYTNYTADVPREQRTIDYYWNINTAEFDKTKFNGKISVFGTIMNTKLTGKTLKDAGFKFVTLTSTNGNAEEETKLEYDSEVQYYQKQGILYKNNKIYPTADESIILNNYQGKDYVYDESTELYYYTSTDAPYLTYEDVVVPYINVPEYSDLTIDDIIDYLGVPTYVENRKTKLEDAKKSLGIIRMDYVYVYDDYLFEFTFSYNENIGVKFNNNTYMGKESFSRTISLFSTDTFEDVQYESYIKFLEEQQDKYLQAIDKK